MKVVHSVFYVFVFRKNFRDLGGITHHVAHLRLSGFQSLSIDSMMILEKSDRVMSHMTLKYVKYLWLLQTECEVTGGLESHISEKYPKLFMAALLPMFMFLLVYLVLRVVN